MSGSGSGKDAPRRPWQTARRLGHSRGGVQHTQTARVGSIELLSNVMAVKRYLEALADTPRFIERRIKHLRDSMAFVSFSRSQPEVAVAIDSVRERHLTYLDREALLDLAKAALRIDKEGIGGTIVEAGTALGGSAIVLAVAKQTDRPLKLYDAFEMIPEPSDRDGPDAHRRYETIADGDSTGIGGDTYYGYQENLLAEVIKSFHDLNLTPKNETIEFTKGLYENSLVVDFPVALAHLDCDWYGSTRICLEQIEPNLVVGGRLVIDDYGTWSGCKRAVDEFFSARRRDYEFVYKSRLHIIKK